MFSRDFTDIKSGESFDTELAVRMSACRNTVVLTSSLLCVLKRHKLLLFILDRVFFKPWPTYFHKERNKIQLFYYFIIF